MTVHGRLLDRTNSITGTTVRQVIRNIKDEVKSHTGDIGSSMLTGTAKKIFTAGMIHLLMQAGEGHKLDDHALSADGADFEPNTVQISAFSMQISVQVCSSLQSGFTCMDGLMICGFLYVTVCTMVCSHSM